MTLAAGVDVGGTKIQAAIVDVESGDVLARERIPTRPERGGPAILANCVELVERIAGDTAVRGVGLGLCEFVDLDGRATSAETIDWRGTDVAASFRHIAPARLESDVRAAALAEARFGAGRDQTGPWVYVTVGTGISFALVTDGRPYAGARGNAIVLGAPPVEGIASGLALKRRAGAAAEMFLAQPDSIRIVSEATQALGLALAALVNALDPAVVVIGGGLGLVESYRAAAVETMRSAIDAPATRDVPVVPARLGADAGSIGAAVVGAGG